MRRPFEGVKEYMYICAAAILLRLQKVHQHIRTAAVRTSMQICKTTEPCDTLVNVQYQKDWYHYTGLVLEKHEHKRGKEQGKRSCIPTVYRVSKPKPSTGDIGQQLVIGSP